MAAKRQDPIEGENGIKAQALRALEARNAGRVAYRMVFSATDTFARTDVAAVRGFVSG